MAYSRIIKYTRPNTGVDLPKVADNHGAYDTFSRDKFAEHGVSRNFSWDSDELVMTCTLEAADKSTMETAVAEVEAHSDATAANNAIKSACQAAGITLEVTDSDGADLGSF